MEFKVVEEEVEITEIERMNFDSFRDDSPELSLNTFEFDELSIKPTEEVEYDQVELDKLEKRIEKLENLEMDKINLEFNQNEMESRLTALEKPHLITQENKRLQTALDDSNKASKKKDSQIKKLKTQVKDLQYQVATTEIEMKAITDAVAHAAATIEAASNSTVAKLN